LLLSSTNLPGKCVEEQVEVSLRFFSGPILNLSHHCCFTVIENQPLTRFKSLLNFYYASLSKRMTKSFVDFKNEGSDIGKRILSPYLRPCSWNFCLFLVQDKIRVESINNIFQTYVRAKKDLRERTSNHKLSFFSLHCHLATIKGLEETRIIGQCDWVAVTRVLFYVKNV